MNDEVQQISNPTIKFSHENKVKRQSMSNWLKSSRALWQRISRKVKGKRKGTTFQQDREDLSFEEQANNFISNEKNNSKGASKGLKFQLLNAGNFGEDMTD